MSIAGKAEKKTIQEILNCKIPLGNDYSLAMEEIIDKLRGLPGGSLTDSLCSAFIELYDIASGARGKRMIEESNKQVADMAEIEHAAWEGGYKDAKRDMLSVVGKMKIDELQNCPDCGAKPGEVHKDNCDVERCSVCGLQRLGCECEEHNKNFARWTGLWPGEAEAAFLGVDLNTFYTSGIYKQFFVEPK